MAEITYWGYPGIKNLKRQDYLELIYPDKAAKVEERMRPILKAIEAATGYTLKDIRKKNAKRPMPFLRGVIAKEIYMPGVVSYMDIGRHIGLNDHTSVRTAIRRAMPQVANDQQIRALYERIYSYLQR